MEKYIFDNTHENQRFDKGTEQTEILKERQKEQYEENDKEVKMRARKDKRKWITKKAVAARKAAENGKTKEIYSIAV